MIRVQLCVIVERASEFCNSSVFNKSLSAVFLPEPDYCFEDADLAHGAVSHW